MTNYIVINGLKKVIVLVAISICLLKCQQVLNTGFIFPAKVIIKYTAYAPAFFIAVPVYKVVIAFFFECRIKGGIKCIAGILIDLMKMFRIFFK